MFESIINCFKIRKYSGLKILIQDLTPYIILATYNILCVYSIYNKKEDIFIVLLKTSHIINFEFIGIITLHLLIFGVLIFGAIALVEQIKKI